MGQKLIIVGDSAFAEIAYEYFTYDSDYEVVAFAVEKTFKKQEELFGLPIVALEDLPSLYAPQDHAFFAAITYTQLNRLRTRLYHSLKEQGYKPASYVSSKAFVWRNVVMGEHCFIFEDNTVQPFVTLGNNVVLWSGNHIGHHSKIQDNCFISSHVVVSGYCNVGENCFVGVNATFANNVEIGRDCLIGAGTVILNNIEEDKVTKGAGAEGLGSAKRIFRVSNQK